MEGTDVCFAPVLTMSEAAEHPHNVARGTFVEVAGVTAAGAGAALQPHARPRSRAPPGARRASTPARCCADWGFDAAAIEASIAAVRRQAGRVGRAR